VLKLAARLAADAVKPNIMQIITATNHRQQVENLLSAENLPIADLPDKLDDFVVAIRDNDIIGVAGLEIYGSYALLRSVAVRPDERNKGITWQLLKAIEELASKKRVKEIYLLTETAPEYFHLKGYRQISRNEVPAEVQRSSEFSHVCPQSAVVMKKIL
jgi:amino-acid N-acetyltransferase